MLGEISQVQKDVIGKFGDTKSRTVFTRGWGEGGIGN